MREPVPLRTSVDARAYILYYRWHRTGELTRLLFQALRHRFLWRQRAPIDPGEIRRTERWLATGRVFLAISALGAVRLDPGGIGYPVSAYRLLAISIAHGVVI